MQKNNTLTNVLLAIMGVMIVGLFILEICLMGSHWFIGGCILVSLLFIALYGFWLYKKPHGNLLKIAMLLFAFTSIICSAQFLMVSGSKIEVVRILAASLTCYCAGRLNRIEQNKILFPIIDIVFFVISFNAIKTIPAETFLVKLNYFCAPIVFTTLMIAYFTRYKAHKEAGLMDAPTK